MLYKPKRRDNNTFRKGQYNKRRLRSGFYYKEGA